ncbi:MAG TPA: hypothetical protein VF851_09360 [Steroidobacteraceae bacterium]
MFDLLLLVVLLWPVLAIVLILMVRRWRRQQREALEDWSLQVDRLHDRVARLERNLASLTPAVTPTVTPQPVPEAAAAVAVAVPAETPAAAPVPEPVGPALEEQRPDRGWRDVFGFEPAAQAPATTVVTEQEPTATQATLEEFTSRRRELERRFLENWTGILGSVVVVAGVTFVGIYTALRLAPFYRFLMTLAVAAAFLAASFVLARKESWRAFAGWLRSAGAAILLFACAAAGGLPGLGLQWITEPVPALLVLLVGIGANLGLAYAGGTQVAATLHVLLSLLPLAIVPATSVSFALASVVTGFGVALAARGRWDRHLGIVLGAYAIFQFEWVARTGVAFADDTLRYLVGGCAALVFAAAALVHYRKDYAQPEPPRLQVGVHLLNWAALAAALFAYLPSPRVRGAVLIAAAVLAYRLARRAQVLQLQWLRRADLLTAQALALLALLTAFDFEVATALVLWLAFAETLAFRWLVPRGDDDVLELVIDALPPLAGLCLILCGAGQWYLAGFDAASMVALIGSTVLAVLGQRLLAAPLAAGRDPPDDDDLRSLATAGGLLGVESGVLAVAALGLALERPWLEWAALGIVGLLLGVIVTGRERVGLRIGVAIALVGAHCLAWSAWLREAPWVAWPLAQRVLPLAALAGFGLWALRSGWQRSVTLVLVGLTAGAAAFLFLDPLSYLAPSVAWLVLSLLALEIANRRTGPDARIVLGLGLGYLAAFIGAYALVVVQVPVYVGALNARLLVELFALAVFAYWWVFRPRPEMADFAAWRVAHPLFVELILVAAAVVVVVEVPAQWWAVGWAVLGLGLLSPAASRWLDERTRLYSLLFYWASIVDVAVVLSSFEVPSLQWYERGELLALAAIGLQIGYAAWSHRALRLQGLTIPRPVSGLASLAERVGARRNLYVYYPLFAGIAVFLYWRFDRSVLTLLWAAEAFVIFGLSAWLRENQFRYVALGALAACLARLVLVDMAEANLAVRGIVFIGVGLLMLGMNAIYNRFRARFEA